ncbi:hypothetical protein Ddye_017897 [Dipteronia dyeriana]|uniref:Protein FAR1-RELATED SEQUENCE n=1 Tax=Dipteronia dyeriana TaxID=168575 RepID=A0AAD9UA85_9ROSI|nr:hypothetical protein Ddye_017897 [Dipteronia dyeriana]
MHFSLLNGEAISKCLYYCKIQRISRRDEGLNRKSGSNLEFEVKEDVKFVETCHRVTFMVYLDVKTYKVNCSCRLFEFKGVLCHNAIMALIDQEIFCVPDKYILKCWRKDVKWCHTKVKISYVDLNNKSEGHRFDKMCTYCYDVADFAMDSDEKYNEVMKDSEVVESGEMVDADNEPVLKIEKKGGNEMGRSI